MRDTLRRVLFTLALLTVIQISSSQGDNGGFSEWTNWSDPPCGKTCGQGVTKLVYRNRQCTFTPANCSGSFLETKETICSIPRCPGPYVETKEIPCTIPRCPVNGGFSEWGMWVSAACSATCQGTLTLTRTRSCTNPSPLFNGAQCQGPLQDTQQRSCGDERCPGDSGGFSEWTNWSDPPCGKTCGQGVTKLVYRNRTCTPTPANCSEPLLESKETICSIPRCPVNGNVSSWTSWNTYSSCSKSCGTNAQRHRTRSRTCTNPVPAFGGKFCDSPLVGRETQTCGLAPCPGTDVVSPWTSWEVPRCQVQVTCGVAAEVTVTRSRSCDTPANGVTCSLSLTETRTFRCGTVRCPAINGGMSVWTSWSEEPCSATFQNVNRTRSCTNPAPQYGGNDCSGPRFESMKRTCTRLPSCPMSPIESGVIGGAVGMALTLLLIGGLATCLLRTGRLTWRSSACTDSADGRHTTDTGDTGQIPAHAHMSGVTSHDYAELNDLTRERDAMPTYEVIKNKVYDNNQN